MVQAEAGKTRLGPWILNCMAPDEGNMHTLLHWGTDEQKDNYLRRLCEGTAMSCFAMTEPEVAGSDPTLIQTRAEKDGDEWIINGHKWFISNARRAHFGILVARTEPDVPPGSRGANTAFLVDLPAEGWNNVHAKSRPCMARRGTRKSLLRIFACTIHRFWGAGATDTVLASTGWGPHARALHALDRPGGGRPRHDGRPVSPSVFPRITPRREARGCSG